MGRRQKNKQGDPDAFVDRQDSGPAKKLGKRKPEHDDGGRPVKKAKESVRPLKGKPAVKKASAPSRAAAQPIAKAKGKGKVVEDDGDLGWEDMEDDIDLKAKSKYLECYLVLWTITNGSTDLYSRTRKTKMSSKASQEPWRIWRWKTTST